MRNSRAKYLGAFSVMGLAASVAFAAIDAQPLAPDGVSTSCAIGSDGTHVAVPITKGSRFAVVLDGVEGPKIDALLQNLNGFQFQPNSYWTGNCPAIVFSDDGAHCAYFAKMGDEYVVMLDNKELARAPLPPTTFTGVVPLMFSAGGKHLFYTDGLNGKIRIVVDGKMGPDSSTAMPLATSPDGEHYAYTGFVGGLGNGVPNWTFVDGRQVNYFGDNLKYTGRIVLMSRMNVDNAQVLLFNAKPSVKAARLDPTWVSPDGNQIAIVVTPNQANPSFLTVNGKIVDGTQGLNIVNVYFSPNGKRYAALCESKTHSRFMIIDGKKGEEYQNIPITVNNSDLRQHLAFVAGGDPTALANAQPQIPGFTPDSSKFVYVANQGSQQFLNEEDQESNGYVNTYPLMPVLSTTGNRIAYYAIAPDGTQHVVVDDKEVALPSNRSSSTTRITGLSFSPGGTRVAYLSGGTLYVDGVAQPGYLSGSNYIFSPDDQHFAYTASVANTTDLLVDGKVVDKRPGQIRYAFFSPDSQHLYWIHWANYPGTKDSLLLMADGEPVIHLTDNGLDSTNSYHFQFPAGGPTTFIGRTDGLLRRFSLTLPSNVSGMLATATIPKGP